MSRKLFLSLAAVATLVTAVFVSATDASARSGPGGGGMRMGGGSGIARAHVGGIRHMGLRPGGFRHGGFRPHLRPHFRPHLRLRPHFFPRAHVSYVGWCKLHPWRCRPHFGHYRHWCWRFPWRCRGPVYTRYIAPTYVAAAPVAAYAAAPAPRCTCLTKQFLQDGSGILFKDVCTKEEAFMPYQTQQQSQAPSYAPPQAAYQEQAPAPYQQAQASYQGQPPYQGQAPYPGQAPSQAPQQ